MSLRRRCRIAWWGGKARCCWTRRERRWASCRDDSSHRTLRPAEVAADGITAAGGGTYAISSGTRVLLDGAVSTYGDCWYEMEGREQVTLYYTDSGALDLGRGLRGGGL